jgi:hypothetical protein
MLKTIITICACLMLAGSAFGWQGAVGVAGSGAVAASYPDILFYWGMESAATEKSGKTMTLGDATSLSTAYASVGTHSMLVYKGSGSITLSNTAISSSDILSATSGRFGVDVLVHSYIQNTGIIRAYYDAGNCILCNLSAATIGEVRCAYSTTEALVTTSCGMTLDNWTYIEFAWGGSPKTMEIFCNGTSRASSTSALVAMNQPNDMQIGDWFGSGAGVYLDQALISSDPARDLNALKADTSF